ncbi:MAG: 4Fe-4S dicluster domain-containing protein [Candidatus ainarchaeum sp.]|nr:4Fe-4S dicluster domain-containing protein [Candidatus ainarchaeum sp.]
MGYFLKKKNLLPYLEFLQKEKGFQVLVPLANSNGATCFEELSEENSKKIFLDSRAFFSAKKFFLPNREREFLFEKKAPSFKVHETVKHRQKVVFGLRSCDLHALNALDKLFLDFYGYDSLYRNKRNTCLTIGLECSKPGKNCFCDSMGTSKPDFFDLFFWEKKDGFFVEIGSVEWERLYCKKFFEQTRETKNKPMEKCGLKLDTENLEQILEKNFEHKIWASEAERCLSCSSCTQICPTCYCFTIEDFFIPCSKDSERFREWDSCQLQQFTKVHGGVFRSSRKSRLRQFVMHKLSFFRQQHSVHLCVGCGRCIEACPVKISLVEIARQIQKNPIGGN